MRNNDLEQVIAEAEGWIERLKALRVKHEAPTVRGVPFEDGAPCPNHGNSYCMHCNWPPRKAAPTTGYTAVDMTTAAAQGFRDGQASMGAITEEVESLMVFYQAKDLFDLIDQQADHVKLLQLRLSPYLNEPNPIARIREG